MNAGAVIKDNANPTILAVNESLASASSSKRRRALEYPEVAALCVPRSDTGEPVPNLAAAPIRTRSIHDRIILRALADSAAASKGTTVALLRNLGLNIPLDSSELGIFQQDSLFVPSHFTTAEGTTATTTTPSSTTVVDPVTSDEIFDIIRNIQDPEHPLTLEQLGVVSRSQVTLRYEKDNKSSSDSTSDDDGDDDICSQTSRQNRLVDIRYTPTIPHCSMATLIGLCIRVKLLRSLPADRFKVTVRIQPGTHQSEQSVNKQLADKERVCAALENKHLLGLVNRCIANGMNGTTTATTP
jgi:metal-sulfur cluster biosynthetic enzyme